MELLQVRGDSTAGESPDKCQVEEGYCIRVSTGAPVPPGANAVIQIEDTELVERTEDGNDEKVIRILQPVKVGQDIRLANVKKKINEVKQDNRRRSCFNFSGQLEVTFLRMS